MKFFFSLQKWHNISCLKQLKQPTDNAIHFWTHFLFYTHFFLALHNFSHKPNGKSARATEKNSETLQNPTKFNSLWWARSFLWNYWIDAKCPWIRQSKNPTHTRFSESNFTSTQRKLLFLNLLSVTFNSAEKASSINNSRLLVRIWTLRHTSRFLQPGDQPRTLQKVAKMHWTCWIQ